MMGGRYSVESRYPSGALWILNRAKILRMSYDPEGAIRVLQDGLKPDRPHSFREADTLVFIHPFLPAGQCKFGC